MRPLDPHNVMSHKFVRNLITSKGHSDNTKNHKVTYSVILRLTMIHAVNNKLVFPLISKTVPLKKLSSSQKTFLWNLQVTLLYSKL